MTTNTKQNGYVTWPSFLVLVSLVLSLSAGFSAFYLQQFEKRMDGQFSSIEKRLDKIDEKLDRK